MYVYIYELCINVHDLCVCECVREGEKNRESCVCILLWIRRGSQTLWSCSYGRLCAALCTAQCMWWELNSGHLAEQQTLKHGAISEALRLFCSEANSIPLNLCIYFFSYPIPFYDTISLCFVVDKAFCINMNVKDLRSVFPCECDLLKNDRCLSWKTCTHTADSFF